MMQFHRLSTGVSIVGRRCRIRADVSELPRRCRREPIETKRQPEVVVAQALIRHHLGALQPALGFTHDTEILSDTPPTVHILRPP